MMTQSLLLALFHVGVIFFFFLLLSMIVCFLIFYICVETHT